AAAMSASMPAPAQDRYPLRPVRLVIPSVPAGVHDVIGRVWAERVKPQFGTIVIDNRGGGAGSIGPTMSRITARRLQHPAREHDHSRPGHAGHGQRAL